MAYPYFASPGNDPHILPSPYTSLSSPVIINWKNLGLILLLTLLWLKLFDLVSLRLTHRWQQFFTYFDGYRLPAALSIFVPFTLDIIRSDPAETIIIFPGDSTSGGLLYHHSQAIPAYLNQELTRRLPNPHTYNLALSGAHLNEQYLLIEATLNSADIIIFPIHYSFFTGRGDNGSFTLHPELEQLLMAEPSLDNLAEKLWYTYKVRRLLPYLTLGQSPKIWLKTKVDTLTRTDPDIKPPSRINPGLPFSKQTPMAQAEILEQNRLLWEKISYIDNNNPNLAYLRRIGQLKQASHKLFLAYFVPLDLDTLVQNQILDLDKYNQIINLSKQTLADFDIPYIDFNQDNPAELTANDFYNPDHLLPQGNRKVARILADQLSSLLP